MNFRQVICRCGRGMLSGKPGSQDCRGAATPNIGRALIASMLS